jgi:hypothetical protein
MKTVIFKKPNGTIIRIAPPVKPLTESALARRWGVLPATLRNWRYLKKGPVYCKYAGRVEYRMEDILEYEKSKRFSGAGRISVQGGVRRKPKGKSR